MKIPITKPYFDRLEIQAVSDVLESGWVVQGPKTQEFERQFCSFAGVKYAKAVTSCTTALHLALLVAGIEAGDEVVVPAFTFIATANAVEYLGAKPVFCDIDLNTFNISVVCLENLLADQYTFDEKAGHLKNKKNGKLLKTIVPVHLFGLAADMENINHIAAKFNLKIVEDAACAVGTFIEDKHVGSFGNQACFSFHPRKAITTGEGGMVITDNEEEALKVEALRNHGATISDLQRHKKGGYLLPDHNMLGYNYRLTDIQGAIGVEQMKKLAWILNERRARAKKYDQDLKKVQYLITPEVPDGYTHGYQSYVCLIDRKAIGIDNIEKAHVWRNDLMDRLEKNGIATRQGTHAVHILGYYQKKYDLKREQCLNSYIVDRLSISLPLYATMTEDEQNFVIEQLSLK